MSKTVVKIGPTFPVISYLFSKLTKPFFVKAFSFLGFHQSSSRYAISQQKEFIRRINEGETLYLVGITIAGHDTGSSLIECSNTNGLKVIFNNHEERFSGKKNTHEFPVSSIKCITSYLEKNSIPKERIFDVFFSWDYSIHLSYGLKAVLEHFPLSILLFRPGAINGSVEPIEVFKALFRKSKALKVIGLDPKKTVITVNHHESHAYSAYALSPFSGKTSNKTLVTTIDGTGDTGSTSIFLTNDKGNLVNLYRNESTTDSLGMLYSMISSTQGGWPSLKSEGRYMGASAFGDTNRLTNPFYKELRSIIYLSSKGRVFLNRKLIRYHFAGIYWAYAPGLKKILGEPIKLKDMWNPDAVLDVEDVSHSIITQERVDKAAALQLIFEDALIHIVHYWLKKTKAEELVLTGGTALNCIGNMRLIDTLNEPLVINRLGLSRPVTVWVPPVPCDSGVSLGAPLSFAYNAGIQNSKNLLKTPYVCGEAYTERSILDAIEQDQIARPDTSIKIEKIGYLTDQDGCAVIAKIMAHCVGNNGVIAIHQGPSETGPRALGNRSILANPANPNALELINSKVKYREKIRPLAPIVQYEKAEAYFVFPKSSDLIDRSSYENMTIAVKAKEVTKQKLPACVHVDGTSRVQLLRKETNPLVYDFLSELEKLTGHPVSVNTSFNVGSPIVHSPAQAIKAFLKAKGMDGVIFVSVEGDVFAMYRKGARSKLKESIDRLSKKP